jgi:hypothetical protein
MYGEHKTLGTKFFEALIWGMACVITSLIIAVNVVEAGEVTCTTNNYGNMECVVVDKSNGIKSKDTFTVKKPDFLRRQKVVDAENKTVAVCKENFYGNLKCRSK